jgi:ribonuclease J
LVYSGDLRMHGMRPDLTTDFVEKAAEATPDLMLCEGTRINDATSSNENIVYETCNKVATQANERNLFIFADYSYKDIDRFQTFYKLAKSSNRIMLITPKTARYLSLLAENDPELSKVIPKANDEFIGIYKHRAKSGSYADKDYDTDDLESFRQTNVWTYKEVQTNKSKIIMALGAYHVQELIDLNPGNGIYVHSSSEPFNEEGEVDETRTNNWIERFGMVRVHAHCSGHASSGDLNRILDEVSPKQIIPMHTEHPEFFRTFRGDGALRLAEPMKPVLIK